MKAHKHAHLMAEYAKDALETDKPWERWEVRYSDDDTWHSFGEESPAWHEYLEYRRKLKTINIGGIDVPEPMRVKPEFGQLVFFANPLMPSLHAPQEWDDYETDNRKLVRGMVHATKEAAIAHAKALILVSGGKIEE